MCRAFTVPVQFNPPEVDFVITLEETDPEELSVFFSVIHLANDSQNWMPGLL